MSRHGEASTAHNNMGREMSCFRNKKTRLDIVDVMLKFLASVHRVCVCLVFLWNLNYLSNRFSLAELCLIFPFPNHFSSDLKWFVYIWKEL